MRKLLLSMLGVSVLASTACNEASSGSENTSDITTNINTERNTEYHRVRTTAIATGLENPWGVAFLPDGSMLVTEKPGRLNHISQDGSERRTIDGLPRIHAFRQGGLLDVSVHPQYEENGWIYLTYSQANDEELTATTLIRARIEGDSLVDVEELFVQDRFSQPGRHYGSRIAWTNDGFLLMSVGDRGAEPPRAQDLMDHAGTLLRLNDDGSVPSDNPFVGRNDALPEIFSYGHRNIQGLVVDPETNEIWVTDHGPRGGDLLNRPQAGRNYGWPTVTQGFDYRTEGPYPGSEARQMDGIEDPFFEFLPTLAPSGLALITNGAFSNWEGNLLAGGLRPQRVLRVLKSDSEVLHIEELFTQSFGRIRDVRQGPDGHVYLLTDESNGSLIRVEAVPRS
ncbi:Glucose/arabinose dehydrogenase, beta-propeller fold [Cyclonatronum proteinivorum]|uniref:Glucose/arabinose dehydrogenase, beta-propeller fold n=1 Tax=Cyclonatronum proteinivorum TaxID=1457365 RepID=A0A345UNQ1_9BACT|nr:PQQ-dependent sugar dehydrogenase [Cyclonatronum proteinivorum]AXJ02103.1 Glucose/arabinose dehydrogenase, beta-propeller fold [Cyclonatronum proteinivorum]